MGTASSEVAFARSLPLTGDGVRRGIPVVAALHGLGYALLVPFIFFICFTFLRPSLPRHPAAQGRGSLRRAAPALSSWASARAPALFRGAATGGVELPVRLPDGHRDLLRHVLRGRHPAPGRARVQGLCRKQPLCRRCRERKLFRTLRKACCSGWTGVPPACSRIRTCSAHS